MTEQEQKELELFSEWWCNSPYIFTDRHIAEEAWIARANLKMKLHDDDNDNDETFFNSIAEQAVIAAEDSYQLMLDCYNEN